MMAEINLVAKQWTLMTPTAVDAISFQNKGISPILIECTDTNTAPTSKTTGYQYESLTGERNLAIADLFIGKTTGFVWGYAKTPTRVKVSHA
jgi:hypothetical protein